MASAVAILGFTRSPLDRVVASAAEICYLVCFMRPQDLDYILPPEQIAQAPAPDRAASKLLVVDRRQGPDQNFASHLAKDLPQQLESLYGTAPLVVVNDSRVVPARLYLTHESGRRMEFLFTSPGLGMVQGQRCLAWVRRAKRLRVGDRLSVPGLTLCYEGPDGQDPRARSFLIEEGDLLSVLKAQGELPLPPYIRRPQGPDQGDAERYQTVYAQPVGSVAAPTAGLHLDEATLAKLDTASVTLHVGPGTFLPMEVQDVRDHKVGSERVHISEASAQKIMEAKASARPIVAVGTTATRCLEGVFLQKGAVLPGEASVDLVITPGFEFSVISGLFTNFHLPKSSLLMLTCAFGGQARVLSAYRHAVQEGFRFYSYGDCMLLAP